MVRVRLCIALYLRPPRPRPSALLVLFHVFWGESVSLWSGAATGTVATGGGDGDSGRVPWPGRPRAMADDCVYGITADAGAQGEGPVHSVQKFLKGITRHWQLPPSMWRAQWSRGVR